MKRFNMIIGAVALTMAMGASLSASPALAFKDGGPDRGDFTVNGVFDTAGYTAALIAFESAPVLAIDGPVTLSVSGCEAGAVIQAVFVGWPISEVAVVSKGSPTAVTLTPPAGIPIGFNVIRLTCITNTPTQSIDPASPSVRQDSALRTEATVVKTRDVIVDLRPAGTPGIVSSLGIPFDAGQPVVLPKTGADIRSILGNATAAVLLGGAVVFGARRRFRVATPA